MWNKILDLIIKIGTPIYGLILIGLILGGMWLFGLRLWDFISYLFTYSGY